MVSSEEALKRQITQLETLLKKPDNSTCADCNGKTPRWASITFGTFVCLRCSGQHRAMGVHITKIKSVNLDKWPAGKVEAFQAMSNNLVNSYWEANLPKNFAKPAPQAPTSEVTNFLKEKYVNKRWVDTDMKYDPFYLFENKRSRFDKFVQRAINKAQGGAESSDEEPVRKNKKDKKSKRLEKAPSKLEVNGPAAASQQAAANAPDLISFAPVAAPQNNDQFTDFVSAPAAKQDDGFTDFAQPVQAVGGQQQVHPQAQGGDDKQQMINNLMSMMSSNPQSNPSTVKYAAFEVMNDFDTPQQKQQKLQQMKMMQMNGHGQPAGVPQNNPFGVAPQSQPTASAGGGAFQPQFFNSAMQQQQQNLGAAQPTMFGQQPQQQQNQWSATFNTGGQAPAQQPANNGGFGQFNGAPAQPQNTNMFAGMQQQQPQFNTGGMQPQQPAFNMGGFGGFQTGANTSQMPQSQPQQQNGGNYYGGLVNLGTSGQPTQGNQQFGMGAMNQNDVNKQQQQNASFNNLVKW